MPNVYVFGMMFRKYRNRKKKKERKDKNTTNLYLLRACSNGEFKILHASCH